MQFEFRIAYFFVFKIQFIEMIGGKAMRRKNRFNQILEMPRELDSKESKITIISFDEILIENYKGILEYEEFFIKVDTEIGTVDINGYKLTLEQITEDDIAIKGTIKSIELEKNEAG